MRRLDSILGGSIGAFGLAIGVAAIAQGQIAAPQAVETAPLAKDAFSTGTLNRAQGALDPSLWRGSDAETLEFLLLQAPARPATPSLGAALRRILLSPGVAPQGAAPSLGGKKLLALSRAGFLEEASAVASLSNAGRGDPWTGQALATADLLKGDVGRACQRNANLTSGRDAPFWVKLRVLCYANAGERDAADLTLNILREQGGLRGGEVVFLTAAATGVAPKTPPAAQSVLEYAIAKKLSLPLAPGVLHKADGGVLVAIARDGDIDAGSRIAAAGHAAAMGVIGKGELAALFNNVSFEVADLSAAATAARERPGDPRTDALLYQSVAAMAAPEFLRDKAQRISMALGLADSFPRAYALSLLYADEITALEGAIVSGEEAERFAMARMGVGDSAGAGKWLIAMLGGAGNVSALPEPRAMAFIDRVNLLATLDAQTASQVARAAGVSLLSLESAHSHAGRAGDPAVTARILEAAFDAAVDGKAGQAGLAALAASATMSDRGTPGVGEINAVVVNQSLRVAGLAELRRRNDFEQAWAATYPNAPAPAASLNPSADGAGPASGGADDGGLMPRLKPARTR